MANTPTPATTVTPPNAGGSNKSIPAPKVAVPASVKKWLWLAMVATVIVGTIVLITSIARSGNNARQTTAVAQTICPDASAQETLTCLMTSELSTGIKIAVMADSGKRLCFVPNLPFEKNDVNGTTFWRFKTNGGQIPMKYRLFPEEMQCPDVL